MRLECDNLGEGKNIFGIAAILVSVVAVVVVVSMAGFLDRMKDNWKSNIDYYKKVYGREKPLPSWTDADVEEFVKSDPMYGPQVNSQSHFSFHFPVEVFFCCVI